MSNYLIAICNRLRSLNTERTCFTSDLSKIFYRLKAKTQNQTNLKTWMKKRKKVMNPGRRKNQRMKTQESIYSALSLAKTPNEVASTIIGGVKKDV